MKDLELSDLYNPDRIVTVLLKDGTQITADSDQGFQIYKKCTELWQKMKDGRLMRVKRWYSKSVICYYKDASQEKKDEMKKLGIGQNG